MFAEARVTRTVLHLLWLCLVLLGTGAAYASHSGFAPCPVAAKPSGWVAPGGEVVVTILSAEVPSDIDNDVWFFTNRGDVYGTVHIAGKKFDLPQIGGSDSPHWEKNRGSFRAKVATSPVEIEIGLREYDSGLNFGFDTVDINPRSGESDLHFEFDLCTTRLTGDVTGPTQGVVEVTGDGGGGTYKGTVRFTVELADGRPVTQDDIALAQVDLVQVVHQTGTLVAGKPAVALVRVANNFKSTVSTSVRLEIYGPGGYKVDQTFPIVGLGQAEVRKEYYFASNPILIPKKTAGDSTLFVRAKIDPGGNLVEGLPPGDCRRFNDSIDGPDHETGLQWTIVETRKPVLLWSRVGLPGDAPNFTSQGEFDQIRILGDALIEATFPVEETIDWVSPFAVTSTPFSPIHLLAKLLASIGIPADAALPFNLVFELNGASVLAGSDRLMGVLPDKDWFRRFLHGTWSKKSGVSLGELAPYAVIFLPVKDRIPGETPGPAFTIPGHELGHTYGLSVDPRLKGAFCGVELGIAQLICYAAGGIDEGTHDDAKLKQGNPSTGFWVRRGTEPAAVLPLVGKEQCDSHCLMGTNPQNSHQRWAQRRRWIDSADYERLVRKLRSAKDPEVLYVSGIIDLEDRVHLGPWYQLPEGVPDRTEMRDDEKFAFRFLDAAGSVLLEVSLPEQWGAADFDTPIPATFFAQKLPYPAETRSIEIWNRRAERKIAEKMVSRNRPEVWIEEPQIEVLQGERVPINWQGEDADGDELEYTIFVDGEAIGRHLAAYRLTEPFHEIDTTNLPPGDYAVVVLAADGIHVSESKPVPLRVHADR